MNLNDLFSGFAAISGMFLLLIIISCSESKLEVSASSMKPIEDFKSPTLGFKIGMKTNEAEAHKAQLLGKESFRLNPGNHSWVDFIYADSVPASFYLTYFKDTLKFLKIHIDDENLQCGTTDRNINQVLGMFFRKYGPPTEMVFNKEKMWGIEDDGRIDLVLERYPITYLNYFWVVEGLSIRMRIDPNSLLCFSKREKKSNRCEILISDEFEFSPNNPWHKVHYDE